MTIKIGKVDGEVRSLLCSANPRPLNCHCPRDRGAIGFPVSPRLVALRVETGDEGQRDRSEGSNGLDLGERVEEHTR
uniref:Uncharacterized protein n=1 Tax=Chromera velia CCMP2878 TaxID=1169474 RepID=A0A0G4G245_9ALVE|eukprot:Cvel_4048.t1-p1 / transcript=Cvel_4048.t1 / gene=Cvel_4048 / organism=Chromera_velia_CCMP2878 / gene_product=hypothetical protein / transcript_product=hypothetical protein / location=Cvel_scaffold172:58419-59908(+) / protein_length=76 / sequence_SO=supercontig / SO=protein_coding / is_pseudo=false